jgi:polygalacturonase
MLKKWLMIFSMFTMVIGSFFSISDSPKVYAASHSFNPSDDTYVRSDNPSTSYSTETAVKVRNNTDYSMESYLKFNVSGLIGIQSAKLKLYCLFYGGTVTTGNTSLNKVTNNSWTGSTTTWSNKPASWGLISQVPNSAIAQGAWVTFDVSSYVTDNGTYSFKLSTDLANTMTFGSTENGSNKAVLEVTTTDRTPVGSFPPGIDPYNKYAIDGFLDVTLYGADPTGITDSTAAIQSAIDDAYENEMVVFFPTGTYLVSDTLKMMRIKDSDAFRTRKGHVLIGSTAGARPVIKLANNLSAFNQQGVIKPVVHFWTANVSTDPDPENENASTDYNQVFRGIDIDLGNNNSQAVGIRHRGAEGTSIQDVYIRAYGAYAGIYNLLGSGGSLTNVEVEGGTYGIYAPKTQPMPVLTGITLKAQTDSAIYYRGLTPLTVVGFDISKSRGPVITVDGDSESSGHLSLVDGKILLSNGDSTDVGITNTDRNIYMKNVYVKNAGKVITNSYDSSWIQINNPTSWNKVDEYAFSKDNYPDYAKIINGTDTNDSFFNGSVTATKHLSLVNGSTAPPADIVSKNVWDANYWTFEDADVKNVMDYGAKGDGVTDDTQAIKDAVAAGDKVFLPRGHYKVSGTITLNLNTKLFGAARQLTTLEPTGWSAAIETPIIQSANSVNSTNVLADMKIELYRTQDNIYAIKWMAGRNSIEKDVWVCWDFDSTSHTGTLQRRIIITGNGGGRWYNQTSEIGYDTENSGSRSVLIDGTTEPLTFYMFHNQHIKSSAISEVKNASNVTFYGVKTETQTVGEPQDSPTDPWPVSLRIYQSSNVTVVGYSGLGQAKEWRGLIEAIDSTNTTVANMARWGSSYYPTNTWYYVKETKQGVNMGILANTPASLYKRN